MRIGPVLFAAFVATPLIEIYLFITIGGKIGLGPTLVVVIVTAMVGAALVARQGRAEFESARTTLMQGTVPTKELAHGSMILVAGALLLTPGFLTDAIGFLLLVPQVRERIRRWAARRFGTGPITIE